MKDDTLVRYLKKDQCKIAVLKEHYEVPHNEGLQFFYERFCDNTLNVPRNSTPQSRILLVNFSITVWGSFSNLEKPHFCKTGPLIKHFLVEIGVKHLNLT